MAGVSFFSTLQLSGLSSPNKSNSHDIFSNSNDEGENTSVSIQFDD